MTDDSPISSMLQLFNIYTSGTFRLKICGFPNFQKWCRENLKAPLVTLVRVYMLFGNPISSTITKKNFFFIEKQRGIKIKSKSFDIISNCKIFPNGESVSR